MDAEPPSRPHPWGPRSRDAALRRTRRLTRLLAVGAAAFSGLFSVVAAQAFKGHARPRRAAAPGAAAPVPAPRSVSVPAPQSVPAIAGDRAAPSPPSRAPAPASKPAPRPAPQPAPQPAPTPPPVVSGGS